MRVEDFITDHNGRTGSIMQVLHNTLASTPRVTYKMRYKLPFYYRKSWVCYLNPLKNGNVAFAFTRGNELANENGLLTSKGRKQVYSVELTSTQDINEEVMSIIQEALLLDDTVPYASKRSK